MRSLSIFQITLLAVFGSLAVVGVVVFALFVGSGGGNIVGPVTIWGPFDATTFKNVIAQASESESRLTQVTYVQKDAATYEAEITNALASGDGPDIFILRQDYALRDSGKIMSTPYSGPTGISQSQFENTFVEAANPYLSYAGILGLPFLTDPLVLYWNRDLLSSGGYSQPPRYWDQLGDMVQKLTRRNDAGTILKATIPFGSFANVDNAKDILSVLILQAGGDITREDKTGRLVPALSARTGDTSQAAESAVRFYTEFADPSKANYSWNGSFPHSQATFAAGDLAFYVGFASEKSAIAKTNPNLNFDVAPMPQIRGADRATTVAHVYAFALTRTSGNPQGALTIASLLSATDLSQALSEAFAIPSARRDVLSAYQSQSNVAGGLAGTGLCEGQNVSICSATFSRAWADPDPDKTNDIFRDMINGVTSGSIAPTEAVQRADKELGQTIGQ